MKVKCVAKTGEDLSKKSIKAGKLRTTIFPLSIGKVYNVYGISTWKGRLDYLLDIPGWYPAELFEVVDHLLPICWYFDSRKSKSLFTKLFSSHARENVWSYKEMVLDPKHIIDLLEGELEAVEIFRRRKEEIDEYEELR